MSKISESEFCLFFSFIQGNFSEQTGLIIHIINLLVILFFPVVTVLMLPSITPGEECTMAAFSQISSKLYEFVQMVISICKL